MPFIDLSIPDVILPRNVTVRSGFSQSQAGVTSSVDDNQRCVDILTTSRFQWSIPFRPPGDHFVSVGSMGTMFCSGIGLVAQQRITDQRRDMDGFIVWAIAYTSHRAVRVGDVPGLHLYDMERLVKRVTDDISGFNGKAGSRIRLGDYYPDDPVTNNVRHIMMSASVQQNTVDGIDVGTIGSDVAMFDTEELKMDVTLETDLPRWPPSIPHATTFGEDSHETIWTDQNTLPGIEFATTCIESSEIFANETCPTRSNWILPMGHISNILINGANVSGFASIIFLRDTPDAMARWPPAVEKEYGTLCPVFTFLIGATEYTPSDFEDRVLWKTQQRAALLQTIKAKGVVICLRRVEVITEFYDEMAFIKASGTKPQTRPSTNPQPQTPNPKP
jgi:hypothetical protein